MRGLRRLRVAVPTLAPTRLARGSAPASAVDASPSLVDASALLVHACAPLDGACPPLDGACPPLDGACPPLDGACPPLIGAGAPLDDACTPLDDAGAPLDDACAPPDNASASLADACAPLDDVCALPDNASASRRGGASTIPMQLARQLLRRVPRRLRRKLFEAMLGAYITRRYGKEHVLDVWLANVPFGTPRIIGIELAAERDFDKTLNELDELDGLLLGERVTVCTGRYFPGRLPNPVSWAARQRIISEVQVRRPAAG